MLLASVGYAFSFSQETAVAHVCTNLPNAHKGQVIFPGQKSIRSRNAIAAIDILVFTLFFCNKHENHPTCDSVVTIADQKVHQSKSASAGNIRPKPHDFNVGSPAIDSLNWLMTPITVVYYTYNI